MYRLKVPMAPRAQHGTVPAFCATFWCCGGLPLRGIGRNVGAKSHQTQTTLVQSSFSTLFPVVRPFDEWVAPSFLVNTITLPPIEILFADTCSMFMSGQCTNFCLSFRCPVCRRPFIKSQYSYQCSSSKS